MSEILVLESETIDKIAAGEVVERPLNVVKELVENAMDADSKLISIDIKGGGVELIRVTDNGKGIAPDQVKTAFLRHATSKLKKIDDLNSLYTMGFRGEALSSVAAVSKTEMITKRREDLLGTHIAIDGGKLAEFNEVGAPNGTTVIVKSLFYNTPARKKFLKSDHSEAAMIQDICEKFALARPDIGFTLNMSGKSRISTSGNGDVKDVIYHIYGKEVFDRLLKVEYNSEAVSISGYAARPEYTHSSRDGEIYFVNNRYVRGKVVTSAIENVYKNYLMQHRFPFLVLNISIDPGLIDINVHPQKMEVRFSKEDIVYEAVSCALSTALQQSELIPVVSLNENSTAIKKEIEKNVIGVIKNDGYFNENEVEQIPNAISGKDFDTNNVSMSNRADNYVNESADNGSDVTLGENKPENLYQIPYVDKMTEIVKTESAEISTKDIERVPEPFETKVRNDIRFKTANEPEYVQTNLFENDEFAKEVKKYSIIGQVFDTYWLITCEDKLYIVDQHAAHEKVNYERMLKRLTNSTEVYSQMINPALTLNLNAKEKDVMLENMETFEKIGFEIDSFGDNSYVCRAVPSNLFGMNVEELFGAILDELINTAGVKTPAIVCEKVATMACKASIKGNMRVSYEEMQKLMDELMTLDNPFNCPHGRPTFICITESELERKFKRIV